MGIALDGRTDHAEYVRAQIPDACRDLAGRQCGVIERQQALRAGVRPDVIDGLLRTGRWQRMQQGVYGIFTGEPCREAQLWAVLLRAGPDAALSHRTAAALFGLAGDSAGPTCHRAARQAATADSWRDHPSG